MGQLAMAGSGLHAILSPSERFQDTNPLLPNSDPEAQQVRRVERRCWRAAGALLLIPVVLAVCGGVLLAVDGEWPVRLDSGRGVEVKLLDFCGPIEADVEYHTRTPPRAVGSVYSARQCCAVCDGHPDCQAWTYGNESGVDGLSNTCYLKSLGTDEEVVPRKREGVVSGLLVSRLQKHGVVAATLAKLKLSGLPVGGEENTLMRNEDTCRGRLSVMGHGTMSVVGAAWKSPQKRASAADVPPGSWAVIPRLGSRVYLAEGCTPGRYNQSAYAALHLLGRKLRYKVDLSGQGCGCSSLLQLVPMRQNPYPSMCHDYYCSPAKTCSVPCGAIEVQSANRFSWATSIHVHDDRAGTAVGYGGGINWVGKRDWNSSQYKPGGECIDTSWPFEVSISFPIGSDGRLQAVEVLLSQSGSRCSVGARIDEYSFRGRDGLSEVAAVLEAGVTPSMSYWSSKEMLWLDGSGIDGQGPCVQDAPQACAATTRFFDFRVEDPTGAEPTSNLQGPEQGGAPLAAAISELHQHQLRMADVTRQEKLANATQLEPLKRNCVADCETEGSLDVTYGPGDQQEAPGSAESLASERKEGNIEWEVLVDRLAVKNASGEIVGKKKRGEVFTGRREGNFVQLSFTDGYAAIKQGLKLILRQRSVTYVIIASGSCLDHGLYPITDSRTCEAAGFALGYFDTKVQAYVGKEERPEGCHLDGGELVVALGKLNRGRGVQGKLRPICSSMPYPVNIVTTTTTTVPTTTTQTSSTATTTTTPSRSSQTTTTWGKPSLFCFMVVQVTGHTGELELVRVQVKSAVGVFLCDEYAVFTEGKSVDLGKGPYGPPVESVPVEKTPVWSSHDGDKATALLFTHAWKALHKDGRYNRTDWTVKADPDTVLLPWRVRRHLASSTGLSVFLVVNGKRANAHEVNGAVEAYSRQALEEYFRRGDRCMSDLKWQQWAEDSFMGACLSHLRVARLMDSTILIDTQDQDAVGSCTDKKAAAFHDYKGVDTWFACWNEAVR